MLGKLVIYDIKCGRGYTYSACLVPFLLIGFNCLILRNQVISLTAYSGTVWKASSADFLFSFMKGIPVFVIAGAQTRFEVPAVWLIFHWWPSFIISAYVIRTWKLPFAAKIQRAVVVRKMYLVNDERFYLLCIFNTDYSYFFICFWGIIV